MGSSPYFLWPTRKRRRKPPLSCWYGRQDLNLHGYPLEPKSNVSANSTTPAFIKFTVADLYVCQFLRLRCPAETSPDKAGSFPADRSTRFCSAFSAPGSAEQRGHARIGVILARAPKTVNANRDGLQFFLHFSLTFPVLMSKIDYGIVYIARTGMFHFITRHEPRFAFIAWWRLFV